MNRRGFLYFLAASSSFLGIKPLALANSGLDRFLSLEQKSNLPIGFWVEKYVNLWKNSLNQIPDFLPQRHHKMVQMQHENRLRKYTLKMEKFEKNSLVKNELFVEGRDLLGEIFGVNLASMNLLSSAGMLKGFSEYLEIVRKRDPNISAEDIFQAGRNVATAMTLQYLSGQKMELTDAIYGYSMLYPYTDNLLDDQGISSLEKLAFSGRFGQRLAGEISGYSMTDAWERRIFPMIDYIENQWPRKSFPEVYESLLAIHDMQLKSLSQQRKLGIAKVDDILRMSIEKGGASVLADAFLVTGNPDIRIAEFAFGFGALLQLIDDLQDVKHDMSNRNATLFTIKAHGQEILDEHVYRLMHMAKSIFNQVESLPGINSNEASNIKKLLEAGIFHFIGEVVANNPNMFSQYLADEVLSRTGVTASGLREMNIEKTFLQKFRKDPEQIIKILKALA